MRYLDMIYPRLEVIQKLISDRGSIFVHLDWHLSHYVKVIMDEIFGYENFRNEIIIKRGRRKNLLYQFKSIDRMHVANDSILWYSKSAGMKFQRPLVKNKRNSKWMGFWSNVNRPTMRYEYCLVLYRERTMEVVQGKSSACNRKLQSLCRQIR